MFLITPPVLDIPCFSLKNTIHIPFEPTNCGMRQYALRMVCKDLGGIFNLSRYIITNRKFRTLRTEKIKFVIALIQMKALAMGTSLKRYDIFWKVSFWRHYHFWQSIMMTKYKIGITYFRIWFANYLLTIRSLYFKEIIETKEVYTRKYPPSHHAIPHIIQSIESACIMPHCAKNFCIDTLFCSAFQRKR